MRWDSFANMICAASWAQELTESIAEQVGRAYCTYVKDRGVKTISVGRDGRLSSPGLVQSPGQGAARRRTECDRYRDLSVPAGLFLSVSICRLTAAS